MYLYFCSRCRKHKWIYCPKYLDLLIIASSENRNKTKRSPIYTTASRSFCQASIKHKKHAGRFVRAPHTYSRRELLQVRNLTSKDKTGRSVVANQHDLWLFAGRHIVSTQRQMCWAILLPPLWNVLLKNISRSGSWKRHKMPFNEVAHEGLLSTRPSGGKNCSKM